MRTIKLLATLLCLIWQCLIHAQDTMRIMHYNLMNYPSSSSIAYKNQQIATIIQYVKPDIFVVNELNEDPTYPDAILNGALNINGETKWARAVYSCTTGAGLCNMLYYDNTKFGLKAQYVIPYSLREMNRYLLYYKAPDLSLTQDTIFFHVVSAHLKASSGTTNENTRNQMATIIMNHLASNNVLPGSNVMVMGDFNIYGSYEPAYNTFITNASNPTVKFNDLLPMGGNVIWNNAIYAPYHTQSTRVSTLSDGGAGGGMDDRFDMIFFSDKLLDGSDSIEVITSSYKAVAQDGLRYNGAINNPTNNSAPSAVVSALYNNSDHLPVMTDLLINFLPPLQAQIIAPTTSPTAICAGENTVLQAYTAPGYTHQWFLNGSPITGATAPTYTTAQAGSYTVQINYFGYTKMSAAIQVNIIALPTPVINGDSNPCENNTFNYWVSDIPGHIYQWEISGNGTIVSGQGTSSINVNWDSGTIGTVSVVEISNN